MIKKSQLGSLIKGLCIVKKLQKSDITLEVGGFRSCILFTPVMVSNCCMNRVVRSSKFYSLDFFNFAKPLILKSCETMIGGKKPHVSEILNNLHTCHIIGTGTRR